jgi:hypothetical protein
VINTFAFFFFFAVLGLVRRAFTLSYSTSPIFCDGFLQDRKIGSCNLFVWGWLRTTILLITASELLGLQAWATSACSFFFLVVLGFELSLILARQELYHFCFGYFKIWSCCVPRQVWTVVLLFVFPHATILSHWDGISRTIWPCWLWTMTLLVSASRVARLTGMSPCLGCFFFIDSLLLFRITSWAIETHFPFYFSKYMINKTRIVLFSVFF